jgi:hypothetical protein
MSDVLDPQSKKDITVQLQTPDGYDGYRVQYSDIYNAWLPQRWDARSKSWGMQLVQGKVMYVSVRGKKVYDSSVRTYKTVGAAVNYCIRQIEREANWK